MAAHISDGVLRPDFLESITKFWFRHLDDEHIIAPDIQDSAPWFNHSPAFDKECISLFSPALEVIHTSQPTSQAILSAANPTTPLHWISLIILLDQLPRNCYRGTPNAFAFDHLALQIAVRAIELGIPQHPTIRFRLAYIFWIYMPLEHSESLSIQDLLATYYEQMFSEFEALIAMDEPGDGDARQCKDVLMKRNKEYEDFSHTLKSIVEEHRDVVRRFGRYPGRNGVLGRESTEEEREWLKGKEGWKNGR